MIPNSPDEETPPPEDRLTTLDTNWTTIRSAHLPGPEGQAAMRDLIGRYHDAVERYLRLKLRDRNLADEVFQDFWTKLLTHKLAGADHNKGRFRDYLRTVLHRLRSEEHTSELQSHVNLVCRLLLEKKKKTRNKSHSNNNNH